MRTTIDLPDELYRSLKARAALNGVAMRELVQSLVEQGLRSLATIPPAKAERRRPPPVIIAPRGIPIQAMSSRQRKRSEELEDEAKHGRSA